VGGHDIAFIYPLIPCKGQLCSLSRTFHKAVLDWAEAGSKKQIFEMKKNKSREKRSGRRGSEHAY